MSPVPFNVLNFNIMCSNVKFYYSFPAKGSFLFSLFKTILSPTTVLSFRFDSQTTALNFGLGKWTTKFNFGFLLDCNTQFWLGDLIAVLKFGLGSWFIAVPFWRSESSWTMLDEIAILILEAVRNL